MREGNRNRTLEIKEGISRYKKVKSIYMTPDTYLKILEENRGITENGNGYMWLKQVPIKYIRGLPLWGKIPIIIDEYAPEWAIVEAV